MGWAYQRIFNLTKTLQIGSVIICLFQMRKLRMVKKLAAGF